MRPTNAFVGTDELVILLINKVFVQDNGHLLSAISCTFTTTSDGEELSFGCAVIFCDWNLPAFGGTLHPYGSHTRPDDHQQSKQYGQFMDTYGRWPQR